MKPNDLLRDLNDPTWREKEQAHYAKLIDAVPTVKQSLQVENDRLRKELAELRLRVIGDIGQEIDAEPFLGTKTYIEDGKIVTVNLRASDVYKEPICTCPSGDGSLRWPCPVHPPQPKAEPVQEPVIQGPVAAWQERQQGMHGWSQWYDCSPRTDFPKGLIQVSDGITYQWRPLYATPDGLRKAAQQALEAMVINHYSVADMAPHRDVMARREAIEALREALK